MNKNIMIPVLILLVISITANVFLSLNFNGKTVETEQENNEYVAVLEEELTKSKEALQSISSSNATSTSTPQPQQNLSEFEELATQFIQHIYNVTGENFVQVKTSARDIMSKELVDTLFAAPGLDDNEIDFITKVHDVEVFQHTKDKQAIVRYKVSSKQLSNNYKTEVEHVMCLYFKNSNGRLIVEAIQPISDMNEV